MHGMFKETPQCVKTCEIFHHIEVDVLGVLSWQIVDVFEGTSEGGGPISAGLEM